MSKLDVVEIWKELHRMPEPGMKEFKTGAYLADALEKLGYEVTRGVGKTGVVGVVRGKEPGPVVMLRADMDALPFKNEDGSIEYVHACGHDSHSAMVLTARYAQDSVSAGRRNARRCARRDERRRD